MWEKLKHWLTVGRHVGRLDRAGFVVLRKEECAALEETIAEFASWADGSGSINDNGPLPRRTRKRVKRVANELRRRLPWRVTR